MMKKEMLDLNRTVSWEEGTVGAVMCWAVVLAPKMRVNEAIERVRQLGFPTETSNSCYVVTEDYVLRGVVTLRDLILAKGGQLLEGIMKSPFASLRPEDDQEVAAQLMEQFDLLELPVVDAENRLLGVVTADDAMAVLQSEATEDMEKMAAIEPTEQPYLQTGVLRLYRSRILWLLLLMVSATLTGGIINHFQSALAAQVALTAFIPMLMDTGGNCGSQSSVVVIRGLALGEVQFSNWLQVAWKELRVALMCGVTLAGLTFLRILLLDRLSLAMAAVVSLTLLVTVVLSKLIGCLLPILAKRVGADPAVMASPLITTIVDAASLIVYFGVASTMLSL